MAALPRWIDDSTVDSHAMLSAYLWFRWKYPQEARSVGPLPIFEHFYSAEMGDLAVAPEGTVEVFCKIPGCERCLQGRGGYMFRWYDSRWVSKYREMARLGSWQGPPDSSMGREVLCVVVDHRSRREP